MFGVEAIKRITRGEVKYNLKEEINRRRTHEARILEMLKNGEQVDTTILRRISANHTARISGLRKEGHIILRVYRGNGVFEYFYKGQKDQ